VLYGELTIFDDGAENRIGGERDKATGEPDRLFSASAGAAKPLTSRWFGG